MNIEDAQDELARGSAMTKLRYSHIEKDTEKPIKFPLLSRTAFYCLRSRPIYPNVVCQSVS